MNHPATMKAVIVRAPMVFDIEDVPIPQCDREGLLLKVHACGLCGSDLRTLRAGHRRVTLPWIIGHEISGIVVQTGPQYKGKWKKDDMVALGPPVFCGVCRFCRKEQYELCENYREIAQAWPGGFAEFLAVPPEAIKLGAIQRIPNGLDPATAAVAEPIASCINAQEKGQVGQGDVVVVIGAGPVGCIHVALAKANGAGKIIAADISPPRLEFAARFSPDHLIDSSQTDLVRQVKLITNGNGADVVITANAVPQTQVQAVEMAAKGGRILLFGGLPKADSKPGIDTNIIHYNALHLIGTTIFAPRHYASAVDLLASGKIPGDKLITHRFPLSDFKNAASLALEGKVGKAVFLP